jgi:hypothetical protein
LNARLIISQVVCEALKELKLEYPQSDAKRLKELQTLKRRLAK